MVHSESSLVELILIHFSYSGHFAPFGNQVDAMELYVVPSTYCRWLKSIYVMHKYYNFIGESYFGQNSSWKYCLAYSMFMMDWWETCKSYISSYNHCNGEKNMVGLNCSIWKTSCREEWKLGFLLINFSIW